MTLRSHFFFIKGQQYTVSERALRITDYWLRRPAFERIHEEEKKVLQ